MTTGVEARINAGHRSARGWIRDLATILDACLAAGTAAWLVPASVQIVSWSRVGAGRVAVFAPAYALRWSLGAAALAGAALWLLGPRTDGARRRRAHAVAPLAALWVWTIPFVPWLPDRWPLLLVFGGPLRWVVLAAAVAACIARLSGSDGSRFPTSPRQGARPSSSARSCSTCSSAFSRWSGGTRRRRAALPRDYPQPAGRSRSQD